MGSLVPKGNTPLYQVLEMYLLEKRVRTGNENVANNGTLPALAFDDDLPRHLVYDTDLMFPLPLEPKASPELEKLRVADKDSRKAAETLRLALADQELIASVYDGNHECELPADLWQVRSAEEVCPLMLAFWSNELRGCGEQYDGLTAYVSTDSLKRWLKKERKPSGRPMTYDWSAFEAEAISVLEDRGDFDPALEPQWRQSSLEEHMAQWCVNNWGKEPSETQIRKHVKTAHGKFRHSREVGN